MNIPSLLFSALIGGAFTHSLNAAVTIPYEFDAGSAYSDSYSWNWGYNIGYWDETIHVELNIALNLDPIADTAFGVMWDPKPVWKAGIEEIWSVNDASRFGAPIQFHVNWVDDNSRHLTVNVHSVVGNSTYATDLRNWEYNINQSYGAHGMDYTEYSRRMAAHEIGHQLGLYDEYAGGATNRFRPERMNSGGLMHTISGASVDTKGEQLAGGGYKFDYYYQNIQFWYQNNVVPEPSSIVLVGVACLGFLCRRKRL